MTRRTSCILISLVVACALLLAAVPSRHVASGASATPAKKCKKGYKLVKGKCKKVKKAAPTATPTPTPTATPTPTPLPTATQRTGYKFSGMELNWRNDVCALPNCTCGFFFSLHRVVSGQVCGNAATGSWVLTITDD